ncbi:MAG: hypothetical protein ALECFALPRED_004692 [Alectoria fallacina]|uniref:SCP domain-containing protein n=1 Tax=Alectoria fallacina TaxID=1903189 RepID=A0A8H3ENR1_9LECA|nr:MAG: hypothetical protein ALECFALPRED_004692 [Alectoria fallacina]
MLLPSSLSLSLVSLLSTLTAAVLVVETSTSTYTAAAATSSSSTSPSSSTSLSTNPTASVSAQYTSDSSFESSILNSTNTYRAQYNATALSWNTSLASYATSWASKCQFTHSHGPSGENLAEGYANVTDAVDAWGDEGSHYDFKKGGFSESTGHFSQLVWKGTTSVGCGRVDCNGQGGVPGWFVVCEYWPAGNVVGEFDQEVGREVGKLEAVGGGQVGEYLAHVAAKMNGGGRNGYSGFGLWVVGLGMLVRLGVGM